jgi:predicted short-subunit dehydrogenase-like oxidoreductase (DUF2520 family)
VTRSASTARTAVRKIGGGVPHGSLTRAILGADVILITTPDDALRQTAWSLALMGGDEWHYKVVLHTSGANDRTVLQPLQRFGACTGSIHPLQTFSGKDAPELDGVVFAIEGDRESRRVAKIICRTLGGICVSIRGADKVLYHAAATLVAGSALGLVEAATRSFMRIGFSRRYAVRSLLPLMRKMLVNFERLGPTSAWTGPLSRGDHETISRHSQALAAISPRYRAAYDSLNQLSIEVLGPSKNPRRNNRATIPNTKNGPHNRPQNNRKETR